MTSKPVLLAALLSILAILAFPSSVPAQGAPDQDAAATKQDKAKEEREAKEAKERDKANKRAALEREVPIAKEKLARAHKDVADQAEDAAGSAAKAQKEVAMAKAALETFEKREMPAKIAKAQLDLQGAKDNLEDNKEELEQLELMYKDQDLSDKTREIVIRRAKRALDRAKERLGIQQEELGILMERTLPQSREKLVLESEEKQREAARVERASQKAAVERKIGVMAAESEVKRIETELAGMKEAK
jgi:HlyD family secretion protein